MNDPTELDALGQAELVRRGEVEPVELLDRAIERLDRVNGALNAVVTPMYEQAREPRSAGFRRVASVVSRSC
jgi:amidase